MTAPGVSIIMPAFNEDGNLPLAVAGVVGAAHAAGVGFEIIVVDDGSTDETFRIAHALRRAYDHSIRIKVARHETNRGLRAAYETGLALARYDVVTWAPGDGEMAPESIAAILGAIGTADLVIPYHGTPERRTWLRRMLTWGSTWEMNVLLGQRLRYWQGTLCLPTTLARSITRTEPGFFCMAEQLAEALERGCTYVEVPLIHQERQNGVSKAVSLRAICRAQRLILRLWWRLRVAPVGHLLAYAAGGPL